MMEMGLRFQSEKTLSGLLPPHHHQHSDGSNAEESVSGGFGDGICDGGDKTSSIALSNLHFYTKRKLFG
jgi:hypothetical protein